MKRYLVIGNPIKHSLSPELHNYWIKKNNITGVYDKKELKISDIENVISKLKNKELNGINITVPFKKEIIPFLDLLSEEAQNTQSVNTINIEDNKLVGHNTDIKGFELSIKETKFDIKNKDIFIIGAGGVVSSIICALKKLHVSKIFVCNRTKEKAENLKSLFKDIKIIDWGEVPKFDVVINATSLGLQENDNIELDFSKIKGHKLFYDIIYNPKETNFLKLGKNLGNKIQNGQLMFIYQAQAAFELWHGIKPLINNDVIEIFD